MDKQNILPQLNTLLSRAYNLLVYGYYIPAEYYVFHDRKIIYISIPKVACTSLKIALMPGSQEYSNERNNYMRVHRQAAAYCQSRIPYHCKDYLKFAFVRNPFDRLVSCYEDKVKRPVQHNRKYYFSSRYNRLLVRRLFGDEISPDMTFSEFAQLVSRIPDRLSDGHFRSQYSILYKRGKSIADYVGHFENLSTDWNQIAIQRGLPGLQVKNLSDRSDWKSYYQTRDTIELVAKRYSDDILNFDYQDAYNSLISNIHHLTGC